MRSGLWALLFLTTAWRAFAQLPCTAETAQTHAYAIRKVHISQPFVLAPELRTKLSALEKKLNADYVDAAYTNALETAAAASIRSAVDTLGASLNVSKLRIVIGQVESCTNQHVDLLFTVVYLVSPRTRLLIPEVSNQMRFVPASVAIGYDKGLKLAPIIGYDASGGFQAGGALSRKLNGDGCRAFRPTFVNAAGTGGSRARDISANLGSECSKVNYREWSASYLEDLLPTSTTGVVTRLGSFFYHRDLTLARPAGWTIRLGGALDGGSASSGSLLGAVTPASLIGLKGAVGLAYATPVQNVEGSFGEEIERNLAVGEWFGREVVDLRHDLWLPYGDHHDFQMETDFHAGNLFHAQAAPLGSTFLLNSTSANFFPSQNWLISSGPSIRSVSSKRNVSLDSSGGKSYVAVSTLLGTDVFRVPLVPTYLTSEKEFIQAVDVQEKGALAAQTAVYLASELHIRKIAESVRTLKAAVAQLTGSVARSSVQTQFPDDAADCQGSLQTVSVLDIDPLAEKVNVGAVQDLTDSNGSLTTMLQSCRDTLGAELNDSHFNAITTTISQWQTDAITLYQQVDARAAAKKAQDVMAKVTPVFNTLLYQVNTTSLTPLMAVDYLRLVPRGGAPPVSLLGIGPAFRLTLVSSVNFTVGYSFNVFYRSATGPGAFFASITFHDFLRF